MILEENISIIAAISVKSSEDIKKFVATWLMYLGSKVDLIVCVNSRYDYDEEVDYVKIVEFNDSRGMFKYNIQQKKYFAAKYSTSEFLFFIHDRIIINNANFFLDLLEFLKSERPDYLSFLIKNVDGTDSLPKLYMDLNSELESDFYLYLINLRKSRGCIFGNNNVPSINGAAFLLNKNQIKLLDNNYRWGEMEDQKLTFDLFVSKCNGQVYINDFLLTKAYKPELKDPDYYILFAHNLVKLFYSPFFMLYGFKTVYSRINYKKELDCLKRMKSMKIIDFLHKPFHTTIYDNSLEKILTSFRSIEEEIELKVEKKFWGYKITIDE